MPVDVDVIIRGDAADPPLGIFIGLGRQRLERRAIEFQEQIAAADAEAAHWPGVEIDDQFGDLMVQLAEREETAVSQARQDPALDHQHADLGLVAWATRPCRQDRGAVMGRQIEIGPVEARLVPVGAGDADLWIVRHQLRRHTADEGERAGVRADPVGQRLGPARFGVGVAGGAYHSDEDLGLPDLAGAPVDQFDRLPGDEQALARGMRLPHGRRQPALPAPIELAPAAVAVAVGRGLPVLLPQQHQGDAGTAQLVMDVRPIRLGLAPQAALGAGAGIEHRLQHSLAQRCWQRPVKFRRRRRSRVTATVLRAIPSDRAIARSVAPHPCLRRRISRTRIDTLSAGIGSPARHGHDKHTDLSPSGRAITTQGGRLQIGMAAFKSETVADFIPESVAGLLWNQHPHPIRRPSRSPIPGRTVAHYDILRQLFTPYT